MLTNHVYLEATSQAARDAGLSETLIANAAVSGASPQSWDAFVLYWRKAIDDAGGDVACQLLRDVHDAAYYVAHVPERDVLVTQIDAARTAALNAGATMALVDAAEAAGSLQVWGSFAIQWRVVIRACGGEPVGLLVRDVFWLADTRAFTPTQARS